MNTDVVFSMLISLLAFFRAYIEIMYLSTVNKDRHVKPKSGLLIELQCVDILSSHVMT